MIDKAKKEVEALAAPTMLSFLPAAPQSLFGEEGTELDRSEFKDNSLSFANFKNAVGDPVKIPITKAVWGKRTQKDGHDAQFILLHIDFSNQIIEPPKES